MTDCYGKVPCVIPTIVQDYERLKVHLSEYYANLPISQIVFIGPANLFERLKADADIGYLKEGAFSFIDENDVVTFFRVKEIYDELKKENTQDKVSTVNWYYQQFLKMGYSLLCHEEYYLCWDADTYPLRQIKMIDDNGIPLFDVKTELQSSYFTTIKRLFGYGKTIEKSYVSEHMIFKTAYMREMLKEIENGNRDGKKFYEVILEKVGSDNLKLGFSEFETYGTWVFHNYPNSYRIRDWKSFRNANFFVDWNDFNEKDAKWLSKDYHAATFEKYQETDEDLNTLFRNDYYREKLTPEQFYTSVLESGVMGEYSEGFIKVGDGYYPV